MHVQTETQLGGAHLLSKLSRRRHVLLCNACCTDPHLTCCCLLPACTQAVYDAPDPVSCLLPQPWCTKLDAFQRLLLLRVLRPDMLTTAIHSFVKASMGQRFVESPPLDLEACYGDSSPTSPLIFVLSPGSDPMSMLLKFAERLKCQVRRILRLAGSEAEGWDPDADWKRPARLPELCLLHAQVATALPTDSMLY